MNFRKKKVHENSIKTRAKSRKKTGAAATIIIIISVFASIEILLNYHHHLLLTIMKFGIIDLAIQFSFQTTREKPFTKKMNNNNNDDQC